MAERPTRDQMRRTARVLHNDASEQEELAETAMSRDEQRLRRDIAATLRTVARWLEDEGREPEMLAPGEQDPRD